MPVNDLIATIDGDDRWHPRKLEAEVAALERNNADVAWSDVNLIDPDGNKIGEWRKRDDVPEAGDLFAPVYGKRIFPNNPSIFRNELVTRRVFENEGACDSSLENFWDWDRKIRFAEKYTIAHSGEKLVDYRRHPGGISNTMQQEKLFSAHLQVYEKHLAILAARNVADQLRVRLSFETRRAAERQQFGMTEHESYDFKHVYQRVSGLFGTLDKPTQETIQKDYAQEINQLLMSVLNSSTNPLLDADVTNILRTSPFLGHLEYRGRLDAKQLHSLANYHRKRAPWKYLQYMALAARA